MYNSNPIVSDVIGQFRSIEMLTQSFADSSVPFETRGLLISGDAGMGKTHAVARGLALANPKKVVPLQGSSISAARFFAELYECREQGSVLVIDDVDIIHKTRAELSQFLDLIKGATEMTSDARQIQWLRTNKNNFLTSRHMPESFDFQGSLIWITNDTFDEIAKKAKGHWHAIKSRFLTKQFHLKPYEKVQYTLHLITDGALLGENCNVVAGGFPDNIIDDTTKYIQKNWKKFEDMTPRNAMQLASIMHRFPDSWETFVESQMLIKE